MLRHSPAISDFVCPIPICQSEADLGSILKIFQHFNCRLLAISLEHQNWGIINSADLLSLLAKAWLGKKNALVSRSGSVDFWQSIPQLSNQDFNRIIKPAKILQSDSKLKNWLDCLQHESVFDRESEYIVVNAAGELQGLLDRHKVIKYLALESQQSLVNTVQNLPSFSHLSSSIDSIALPLKIETAAGKELYLNQSWLKIFSEGENSPQADKTNTQIANWWSEQQENCSAGILDLLPFATSSDESNQALPVDLTFPAQDYAQHEKQPVSPKVFSAGIEKERVSDWNYIRIPLETERQFLAEQEVYYLVLAIGIPAISPNTSKDSLRKTSKVTNNLLATISHELKSPLTGIIGLSSLLKAQKLGNLNQRQARYTNLIHRSGQKMISIVDDLLKLTNLATDRSLVPERINLDLFCRQLYQQILIKLEAGNVAEAEHISYATQLKLNIEVGAEIAIANKLLLSSILNHLILAIIRLPESENQVEMAIAILQGQTAITVSSNLIIYGSSDLCPEGSPLPDLGLDLAIAEYLATVLQGSITSSYSGNKCQLTLLLPKSNTYPQSSTNARVLQTPPPSTNLTILCLYPELDAIDPEANHSNDLNFDLKSWSDNNEQQMDCPHRIIEADSLEQAHNLARIWQLDVIILDGYQIVRPSAYLRSLQESEYLSALPLITLDTGTTEAANQIKGLNVYPCLLPAKHRSIQDLMQVIKIATEAG